MTFLLDADTESLGFDVTLDERDRDLNVNDEYQSQAQRQKGKSHQLILDERRDEFTGTINQTCFNPLSHVPFHVSLFYQNLPRFRTIRKSREIKVFQEQLLFSEKYCK